MGLKNRLNLALLFAALAAWPCFADRTVNPDLGHTAGNGYQPVQTDDNDTRRQACFKSYAAGNCDAIKKSYENSGNSAAAAEIKDCSRPEHYAVSQYFVGCKDGGIAFVVDTASDLKNAALKLPSAIKGLPYQVAKGFEEQANCYKDKEMRAAILAPIKTFYKGDQLNGLVNGPMSCTDLRKHVESYIRREGEDMGKREARQREYDAILKAAPDKKERAERLHPEKDRKLTPEQEEFKKSEEYKKRMYGLADQIVKKAHEAYQCNTSQVVAKKICKVLASVATGTAVGAAVAKYAPQAITSVASAVRRADDGPSVPPTSAPAPPRPPLTQANDPEIKGTAPRAPEPEAPGRTPPARDPDAETAPRTASDKDPEPPPTAARDAGPETQRPTARDSDGPTAPREPDAPPPATVAAADDAGRITRAEETLGRKLTDSESDALLRAHRVGDDKPDAHIGNYTPAQIREKTEILKDGGFTAAERRALIENGVAGRDPPRPAFTERPPRIDIDEPVAIRRTNGGYSNGVVKEIDGDAVKVEFNNPDGTTGVKTVHRDHLRAALREGDEVGVPRTDGSVSRGTVHKVHDDGTADVRFDDKGVPKEKREVPIDRLAPVPREPAPPAARAVAGRPEKPDFNWLKNSAKTDDDIRHFLKHSDDAEFKKFMADYKPGMNPSMSLKEQRDLVRGYPNFVAEIDQKYIGAKAPRGLPPPKGTFSNDFGKITYTADDGSRVGSLHYKHKGSEIHIGSMRTSGQYAGRGVGDQMLKQVIARHPDVTRYSAEMAVSNLAAVQRAIASGASPQQAIMQTPFYKSMNRLGFGRIIESNCSARYCSFVLGR